MIRIRKFHNPHNDQKATNHVKIDFGMIQNYLESFIFKKSERLWFVTLEFFGKKTWDTWGPLKIWVSYPRKVKNSRGNLQGSIPASFGEVQLQGDLGCKLDSLADSYGAIVLEVQDGGSIARWNASNPNKKINKGRAEKTSGW